MNYSETPEHKCAHLFKVETGNYYAYPNNRIIWFDNAWTFNRITKNPGYEIDTTVYSVENKRRMETSDHYMYDVTQLDDTLYIPDPRKEPINYFNSMSEGLDTWHSQEGRYADPQ